MTCLFISGKKKSCVLMHLMISEVMLWKKKLRVRSVIWHGDRLRHFFLILYLRILGKGKTSSFDLSDNI